MNLLLPCAGKSTRYGTQMPKYMLAMPDNRIMLEKCIEPFLSDAQKIHIAILREHEERFGIRAIFEKILPNAGVLVLDEPTRGQAETVSLMLDHFDVKDNFLVKDCDSTFIPEKSYEQDKNQVSVCSLRRVDVARLHQKSFAHFNEQGSIIGMTEKRITSEWFSCGGYYFAMTSEFQTYFQKLSESQIQQEMYISSVIDLMIQAKNIFNPVPCTGYVDLGVFEDWVSYRSKFRTYIFDIDGVIVRNGSRYIEPKWGETQAFPKVSEKLRSLKAAGHYILLVTSRPETYRDVTTKQMQREGIVYDQLVMGVHHGARVVVNDHSKSTPFPTIVAVDSVRDSADWLAKL